MLEHVQGMGRTPSFTTRKILYLCLKNMARLEAKYDPPFLQDALQHYAEALEIDDTDCIVWYDMGCISFQLHQYVGYLIRFIHFSHHRRRFALARMLFERAFCIDSTFWPLVYKLASTLYILQGLPAIPFACFLTRCR
ncbi:hypothetical protein DYB25_001820 [Aphanomyces astaci]|uniref:Uncharacterized protein n=1 Tax=Aphanomyces astaci TaxID=112090 RepID=A0A397F1H7_APHAT|nr:hypothetical protein DYB25_001820 [Aphanomyces astaci]RHZ11949.1 hypothetical protein DYB31_001138 [Aphanomyces astaci]